MELDRRTFLTASVLTASALSAARISGANDRIRCATIGTGGRGTYLTKQFVAQGIEVAAVCDVYEPHLQQGVKEASPGAKPYEDYRRLLEDRSIDAVIIATPDHWHAQMFIDAVQAGKDVYVEKPLAHSVDEGFRMLNALRGTKRIAQIGTQRRSYPLYQEAKRIMDSGATGPVRLVNAWWVNSWGTLNTSPLEGKLNWDLFLGSAPKRPLDASRYFNWLHYYEYSGGILIGQAAHIVDGVQWMMNSTYPIAVTCSSGKPNIPGAEIPETCSMTVEFPEPYILVFTLGYQAMRYGMFNDQMQQFHGSKARFDLGRESYALYQQSLEVDLKTSQQRREPGTFEPASHTHIANFLKSVRDRSEAIATIEMGQRTNTVCWMAIESLRTGRRVRWNAEHKRMES
jgi:predicted dehydrogenase